MPIKVLVISDYRDFHTTRPEASIFIGLAEMGFEVHIMTYKRSGHWGEFEKAGIKLIDFHPEKKFDRSEIKLIREVIQNEKINILHLFNNVAIINGIKAARGLSVKVVLYRGYAGNIHWYDPTAYIKFLHPRVDKIVCNSGGVEDHIQKQLFFDKRKTITINKGHDVRWYSEYQPYDIRKELGLPSDAFLLINVSNNRNMKGIPYLLKALDRIPANLPIHLLLVGRNMNARQNLEIINKNHLKNSVHILGYRENVLNIVAGCDVFVLPSIKGESITKSVIEAMSLGIPPIITDIPGNRELLENEESGLIVPAKDSYRFGEAILRLYNNQPFCRELAANARKRIETHLNAHDTIQHYQRLYETLFQHYL